eukprot:scaffold104843_cov31-Tisochrysis_lutea.AAC.1
MRVFVLYIAFPRPPRPVETGMPYGVLGMRAPHVLPSLSNGNRTKRVCNGKRKCESSVFFFGLLIFWFWTFIGVSSLLSMRYHIPLILISVA